MFLLDPRAGLGWRWLIHARELWHIPNLGSCWEQAEEPAALGQCQEQWEWEIPDEVVVQGLEQLGGSLQHSQLFREPGIIPGLGSARIPAHSGLSQPPGQALGQEGMLQVGTGARWPHPKGTSQGNIPALCPCAETRIRIRVRHWARIWQQLQHPAGFPSVQRPPRAAFPHPGSSHLPVSHGKPSFHGWDALGSFPALPLFPRAIKNGKGLHSKKEVPIHRVADISGVRIPSGTWDVREFHRDQTG